MIFMDFPLFCLRFRDSRKTCLVRLRNRARPKSKVVTPHWARAQKNMFPDNMLILVGVLKQKLVRRTKRPESAKLSDKTRRAKVGKHNANRSKWVLQHGLKCDDFDPRWAFKVKNWSGHKWSFGSARQRVKLSDFEWFHFAYNPGLIFNILMS